MKLNVNEWKEFKVGDLFQSRKIKKYPSIPEDEGKLPFISSSSFNNGVVCKVNAESIEGNCLTVTTNGSCFDVFYHKHPIAVSCDVEVLYSDMLNEKNALFIATVLELEKFKYAYGRKPKNNKVFDTYIKLPVLSDPETNDPILDPNKKYSSEGYIPDFEYMENYITSLKHKPITTACGGANKLQLGIDKWEEFKLSKICSIQMAKSNDKGSLDEGIVPFVGRTASNNGVQCYVDTSDITKGECITVSLVGTNVALWHDADFAASQNIAILRNAVFNVRSALFLCSLLNFVMRGVFSYGRTVNKSDLEAMRLRLPILRDPKTDKPIIDPNNKYSSKGYIPDFEFMERYIKSLPYGDRLEQ